jgi:hypothetical protein
MRTSSRTKIALTIVLGFYGAFSGCGSSQPQPPAAVENAKPQKQTVDVGDWEIQAPEINPIDGTKTQFLSTGGIGDSLTLCFQNGKLCSGRYVGVFVASPCIVEGNEDNDSTTYERLIRLRFDAEQPRKEMWGIPRDRKGIFPHSQAAFVAELYKHKQLIVEFGCDIGDSSAITYDIHNLQAAIEVAGLK